MFRQDGCSIGDAGAVARSMSSGSDVREKESLLKKWS